MALIERGPGLGLLSLKEEAPSALSSSKDDEVAVEDPMAPHLMTSHEEEEEEHRLCRLSGA